jgi:hypothetical protein
VLAYDNVQQAIGRARRKPIDPDENPTAVTIGRLGKLKDGKVRAGGKRLLRKPLENGCNARLLPANVEVSFVGIAPPELISQLRHR